MRKVLITTLAAIAPCVLSIPLGSAQADLGTADMGFRGWGPRIGMSINQDQIEFGAHMDFWNFAEHVRFQPNLGGGSGQRHDAGGSQ
jgi:hypothetical protein